MIIPVYFYIPEIYIYCSHLTSHPCVACTTSDFTTGSFVPLGIPSHPIPSREVFYDRANMLGITFFYRLQGARLLLFYRPNTCREKIPVSGRRSLHTVPRAHAAQPLCFRAAIHYFERNAECAHVLLLVGGRSRITGIVFIALCITSLYNQNSSFQPLNDRSVILLLWICCRT